MIIKLIEAVAKTASDFYETECFSRPRSQTEMYEGAVHKKCLVKNVEMSLLTANIHMKRHVCHGKQSLNGFSPKSS